MTHETARNILVAHSIPFRTTNGVLEVLERWTEESVPFSKWIACPMVRNELMAWLEY